MPGCARRATASAAAITYDMSGSRVFASGVGTAMETVSARAMADSSAVATNFPLFTCDATCSDGTSCTWELAAHQEVDERLRDVVADHAEAGLAELHREREADVPEADHRRDGGAVRDLREEPRLGRAAAGHDARPRPKKPRTAVTTSSICARVSSGNTGSERTSLAARSDSGHAPGL